MWNLDSYIKGKTSADGVWKHRSNAHDNVLNYERELTLERSA